MNNALTLTLTLQKQQILQRRQGKLVKQFIARLVHVYFTRNVSHLSGITTLGNRKSNIDWHSVTVFFSSEVRLTYCLLVEKNNQHAVGEEFLYNLEHFTCFFQQIR